LENCDKNLLPISKSLKRRRKQMRRILNPKFFTAVPVEIKGSKSCKILK
jgi:hypothetical protein